MLKISIALDGPAGAGKSTIAKMIAKLKNLLYIDTGAMYRAVTLKIINLGISDGDITQIEEMLLNTIIDMVDEDIYLDGAKVTDNIRNPEVTKRVSSIAKIPRVRKRMVQLQREMAVKHNIIMDGRDIGTNVLPNATFKFFLTASLEERAKRRFEEMVKSGYDVTLGEIMFEIQNRDKVDSERDIDPLQKADDAKTIDTTNKDIDTVIKEIVSYINKPII